MPERAVAHLEQFRRARSHAVAGFERRHDIGPFHLLHVLFEVDPAFRNVGMAIRRFRLPPELSVLRPGG